MSVSLGPVSGLATPPAAPLTARGKVEIGNAALGVINGDPTTNGITINAGMGIDASNVRITTVPGTPPASTLVGNDASLRDTTEDQMFATFFGMSKEAYQNLPSVTKLDLPVHGNHDPNAYNAGARQIWLEGNLTMNANLTIGSVDEPVLLVTNGNIEMRGDLEVYRPACTAPRSPGTTPAAAAPCCAARPSPRATTPATAPRLLLRPERAEEAARRDGQLLPHTGQLARLQPLNR